MNEDSIKLLEECNTGCKMALKSLSQVGSYVMDTELLMLIEKYARKHDVIEVHSSELLIEAGKCDKEPGAMATAFSWITAEVKLLIKDDNHQITSILMNGCNMGIQSISECQHKYPGAEKKIMKLAYELVKCEEDFMKELKAFV